MWILMATAALGQNVDQSFQRSIGWYEDHFLWESSTNVSFPEEEYQEEDTDQCYCDPPPEPSLSCSSLEVAHESAPQRLTYSVTRINTDYGAECDPVSLDELALWLGGEPAKPGTKGTSTDEVTLAFAIDERTAVPAPLPLKTPTIEISTGSPYDFLERVADEEPATVYIAIQKGDLTFAMDQQWNSQSMDDHITGSLQTYWSPDNKHVALIYDFYSESGHHVYSETFAVRPRIQVVGHPSQNDAEALADMQYKLMDTGPTAVGPAKKKRDDTVIYAAKGYELEASSVQRIAGGTVEPLAWASPADVVVALGANRR